jgi:alcohol dehydrogenase class IV
VLPELAQAAEGVFAVGPGMIDQLAGALRPHVRAAATLVALGGGRVIDTAKSLAAADPPRRVVAIPTTLSGAEMTAIHRHAPGVPPDTPKVRPAVVINDPDISASQPEQAMIASALNALGHAVEAPLTPRSATVPTLAALQAAAMIARTLSGEGPLDRERLALAALLGGYAIDAAGYGLHHVMSQTLVRHAGVGHGPANAAMLQHTIRALARRFPEGIARLGIAVDDDPAALAARLAARAGAARLRDLGISFEAIPELAEHASKRPDLSLTPPAADAAELREIYEVAW